MNKEKSKNFDLSKELIWITRAFSHLRSTIFTVKSHSSTITEEEAERIRTAAEKQVTTMPASSKESLPTTIKPNSQQVTGKARPRPMVPPKPQIVQIKHNSQISRRSNPNPHLHHHHLRQFVLAATPPARTTEQNQSVLLLQRNKKLGFRSNS